MEACVERVRVGWTLARDRAPTPPKADRVLPISKRALQSIHLEIRLDFLTTPLPTTTRLRIFSGMRMQYRNARPK
jgi:hypothetical protein